MGCVLTPRPWARPWENASGACTRQGGGRLHRARVNAKAKGCHMEGGRVLAQGPWSGRIGRVGGGVTRCRARGLLALAAARLFGSAALLSCPLAALQPRRPRPQWRGVSQTERAPSRMEEAPRDDGAKKGRRSLWGPSPIRVARLSVYSAALRIRPNDHEKRYRDCP